MLQIKSYLQLWKKFRFSQGDTGCAALGKSQGGGNPLPRVRFFYHKEH